MLLTNFVIRLKCSITNLCVPLHTPLMLLATVLVKINYLITLFKPITDSYLFCLNIFRCFDSKSKNRDRNDSQSKKVNK